MISDFGKLIDLLDRVALGFDWEVVEVTNQFDEVSYYVAVENPDYKEDNGSHQKSIFIVTEVMG